MFTKAIAEIWIKCYDISLLRMYDLHRNKIISQVTRISRPKTIIGLHNSSHNQLFFCETHQRM